MFENSALRTSSSTRCPLMTIAKRILRYGLYRARTRTLDAGAAGETITAMNRPTSIAAVALLVGFLSGLTLAADIPPGENEAKAALDKSPRHGEWVDIKAPGVDVPIRSYVVYPERKDKAPVVIVIHEIFGLSDWIRSVADQLAADGFIAIAPDLLSGMGEGGKGTDGFKDRQEVMGAIKGLKPDQVVAQLNAVRDYGKKIPASSGKTA